MMKKKQKKMSERLSDAEYRLSSAIIRGEPKEVIEKLREERDRVKEEENG